MPLVDVRFSANWKFANLVRMMIGRPLAHLKMKELELPGNRVLREMKNVPDREILPVTHALPGNWIPVVRPPGALGAIQVPHGLDNPKKTLVMLLNGTRRLGLLASRMRLVRVRVPAVPGNLGNEGRLPDALAVIQAPLGLGHRKKPRVKGLDGKWTPGLPGKRPFGRWKPALVRNVLLGRNHSLGWSHAHPWTAIVALSRSLPTSLAVMK